MFNPLYYRYIPEDLELYEKVNLYNNLDALTRLNRVLPEVVIPRLDSLNSQLLEIANKNKDKQIPKRVNGKHVGKITIQEIFAGYAKRLANRTNSIKEIPLNFDKLEGSQLNDQISDLIYFEISAFSVEANIANDIRHHFRSEIGEFSHKTFGEERVGSSTMPHKRNPVEYERIVSLWKAYLPRATSAILYQVVEHQGDSTNKNLPHQAYELSLALSYATRYLENALKNLEINV
jgi:adenylosuccinate lyase